MSVVVVCNLSEGVVLGADSAVTLSDEHGLVTKVFENAEKLFPLSKRPIGVAIHGQATLNSRGIGSFLREFDATHEGRTRGSARITVQEVAEDLREFMDRHYREHVEALFEKPFDEIELDNLPMLGLVLAGYSAGSYLSEVWHVDLPRDREPRCVLGPGAFGANWFATFHPIERYLLGHDRGLVADMGGLVERIIGRRLDLAERQAIAALFKASAYSIPLAAMPMTEGVAFARFLAELVVNHHRFAAGAAVVGGKVRIGRVTYRDEHFQVLAD